MRPALILPCPGSPAAHFGELLEELAPCWEASRESALRERRGGDRRRAAGAGPRRRLVFVDRLLVTLVHLRLGLPHAALAELYGVDRSTVSGAIREVLPLLASRGFAVPDCPGLRIRTLEDLFAYADAEGVELRINGTKPKDDAPLGEHHAWGERRRRQSSARICVEHTNAEYKQWRPLQRFTGRREIYSETHLTIAGLVSDHSARRATRRKPSIKLVLARQAAC